MRSDRTRHALVLSISALALVATTGCSALRHDRTKSDAQARWSAVRSNVKSQLAGQQYEARRFGDAAKAATEAITLNPTNASAYVLLAKSQLELEQLASASATLEAATRAKVDSAAISYLRGVISEQRGNLESAVAEYDEARRRDPLQIDYLVAQVESLVTLDRAEEALALLDASAHQYDDDATVATLSAHVCALLGDPVGAGKGYDRALTTTKDRALIVEELGRLRIREGKYQAALTLLLPLLPDAEPDGAGALRRSLATCQLALGHPKAARDVLLRYAAAHEDDAVAQMLLAKAALGVGDMVTALRAIDLAERLEPDRPELWFVRAAIRWRRGNLTAAASDLYDYLNVRPDDVEATCLLAEVLAAKHQVSGAKVYFRKALKLTPHFAWAVAGLESLTRYTPNTTGPPTPKLTSAATDEAVSPRRP